MWETWVRFLGQEDPLKEENGSPIPVFLPGKSHGQKSLAGYNPWGLEESDTTEHSHTQKLHNIVTNYTPIKIKEKSSFHL